MIARRTAALATAALLAGCSGDGSDIGPRFPRLPDASSKVAVFDDQGRAVTGARVEVLGTGFAATTGRNGRGDLLADPRGRQRVRVDGAFGAAANGDRLGVLVFAATLAGGDLPFVAFLPDLAPSAGAIVMAGTQTAQTVLDDSATSGARLTIAAGSSVGVSQEMILLRTGALQRVHLPGDLPPAANGAMLFGRGIFVDPPEATFTNATLDAPDDLALGGGATATLYRLDAATGEWTAVAAGIAPAGGRLAGALTAGGLHVFGTAVAAGSLAGRIVDAAQVPLPGMLVGVDGAWTATDGAGRFTLPAVAATDGSGAGRAAAVEVFAGGSWLPKRATTSAPMNGTALVDLGDLALDTVPAGNVRVQQIRRARAEPLRRTGLSALRGAVAVAALGDGDGQAIVEDLPSGWFGFQEGHPQDGLTVFYAQAVGYADPGRRWTDVYQFFSERAWLIGSRRTRAIVTDAVGGGPLEGAVLVRGATADAGFAGITREGGMLFVDRPMEGRATATMRTQRDGRTIVHAFTIDTPNGEHLEFPLQQTLRTPLGAFDRHGLVAGAVTGADPARQHRLRTTRRLELQEWWDDVVAGVPLPSSLPIDVDPAATHTTFQAGVAAAGGHLAVAEVTVAGAVTTLHRLALATDVMPAEAALTARDLALDLAATGSFTAPAALTGLDAGIAAAALAFSLALEQPNGRVVDVVRGIGGNHSAVGADLALALPPLAGQLAGHRWLVLLRGETAAGGATLVQQSLLRLTGAASEAAVELLPVPTIADPAPGATVAAAGFTVQFALPADTLYATLELRSDAGGELQLWQVLLPPTATSFAFRRLPAEAHMPLAAGRTCSLTLTAHRGTAGPLRDSTDPYRDLTSYLQSIGASERGVDALSSRTIQVTAN